MPAKEWTNLPGQPTNFRRDPLDHFRSAEVATTRDRYSGRKAQLTAMVPQDSSLPLECSQFQQWRTIRQQSAGMEPLNSRGLRPRFGPCDVAPTSR